MFGQQESRALVLHAGDEQAQPLPIGSGGENRGERRHAHARLAGGRTPRITVELQELLDGRSHLVPARIAEREELRVEVAVAAQSPHEPLAIAVERRKQIALVLDDRDGITITASVERHRCAVVAQHGEGVQPEIDVRQGAHGPAPWRLHRRRAIGHRGGRRHGRTRRAGRGTARQQPRAGKHENTRSHTHNTRRPGDGIQSRPVALLSAEAVCRPPRALGAGRPFTSRTHRGTGRQRRGWHKPFRHGKR